MRPLVINGVRWRVIRVPAGDPRLIDRTGIERVATTDPTTYTICLSEALQPPLLDRVMVHEALHAISVSYGLHGPLSGLQRHEEIAVDEWGAQMVENFGLEAAMLASEALGRPVCVRGLCHD